MNQAGAQVGPKPCIKWPFVRDIKHIKIEVVAISLIIYGAPMKILFII